LDLNINFQKN